MQHEVVVLLSAWESKVLDDVVIVDRLDLAFGGLVLMLMLLLLVREYIYSYSQTIDQYSYTESTFMRWM
jgi:hypothetical protein